MNISEMLEREEGFRSKPYICSGGYPTIGIGWKIGRHNQSLNDFEIMTICKSAAHDQCEFMVAGVTASLSNRLSFFYDLSEARQCVLISMAYQMGINGLLGFKNMIDAIEEGDFINAAHEGLDSLWAKQTPERAERQMKTLLHGKWSEYEAAHN